MSLRIPRHGNGNPSKCSALSAPCAQGSSSSPLGGFYPPVRILEASPRCLPPLLPTRSYRSTLQATAHEANPSTTETASNEDFHIRAVTPSDYWAVADMHCEAFYPRAGPLWGPMLRLDRVMALQIGKEQETVRKLGRVECLLAVSEDPSFWQILSTSLQQESSPSLGFLVDTLSKAMLPTSMRENYAAHHASAGILGAVVIDTMLEHVPLKKIKTGGGVVREKRRQKMAYLSNLAVAPAAKRRGLGTRLLQEAEDLAIQWGCRSMTLHVDPGNTPAVELYKNAGYKFAAKQPEWQRMIEGRQTALALMIRVLPRR